MVTSSLTQSLEPGHQPEHRSDGSGADRYDACVSGMAQKAQPCPVRSASVSDKAAVPADRLIPGPRASRSDQQAAGRTNVLAGDPGGIRAGEEGDHRGPVLRPAEAMQGGEGGGLLQRLGWVGGTQSVRVDGSGCVGVDGDAQRAKYSGGVLGVL